MISNRTLAVAITVWTLGSAIQAASVADTPESAQPIVKQVDTDTRIWIEAQDAYAQEPVEFNLDYPESARGADPILFQGVVKSGSTLEGCTASVSVEQGGDEIQTASLPLTIAPGATQFEFVWPHGELAPGTYTLSFSVVHDLEGLLAWRDIRVRKLARTPLEERLASASLALEALVAHLDMLRGKGLEVPYAELRVEPAKMALTQAEAALTEGAWQRTDALADYVASTVDSVRAELAFGGFASKRLAADISAGGRLSFQKGGISAKSDGQGRYLIGTAADSTDAIPCLKRHGLNLAWTGLPADHSEAGLARVYTLLDSAEAHGISVIGNVPGPGLLDSETARVQVMRRAAALAPALADRPALAGVCLASEPRFLFGGEPVRQRFIDYVTTQFDDYEHLNLMWRSHFLAMDELELVWDVEATEQGFVPNYLSNPAYRYDWLSFHQRLAAEYLQYLTEAFRQKAPGVPAYVSMADTAFEVGDARWGINREVLASKGEITGATATLDATGGGPHLAMGYPQPVMYFAFLSSLAPEQALVCAPFHLHLDPAPYARDRFAVTQTALWQAALAGVDAVSLLPSPLPEGATNPGPLATLAAYPECLEAASVTCLDLNRLYDEVHAFSEAPSDVGLLWSMSSKILDKGSPYLGSITRAFEGVSYFGRQLRFISERQCAEDGLAGIRFLVIPEMLAVSSEAFDALQEYAADGGIVIRRGRPIPYDARGASRQDVLRHSTDTFIIRGDDGPDQYLQAMDAAYTLSGLPPFPRVVNTHGYPLEGVVSKWATINGKDYVFIVNLRKEDAWVHLSEGWHRGRDRIREQAVSFPCWLEPLQPMLVELDNPEWWMEPEDEPAQAQGTPRAVIGPVEAVELPEESSPDSPS